ncbi:MAG: LPS export ABC transporter ATP-binding protein [Chitinophagales bacterium]
MLTLRSEHLLKVYKNRAVVNDVSVQVNQGEIVGLLGPNGAGKTTSFYQIVGLIPPDSGKIFLGDLEITSEPMYKRAQLGVGYLPQEASVFRNLSVEDNISSVLEMTALSKAQQKARLEELLGEFGLNRVRKSMGNVLSGGERRRTEIARALATAPKFILLDEPFAGIDPIAVEDIQRIVIKLKEKNIGVLITDHNVQETLSITDRAYLLFEGKILKQGTAEELANDEQVRKVYLGQNFILHRKNIDSNVGDKSVNTLTAQGLMRYTDDVLKSTERLLEVISKAERPADIETELVSAGYKEYCQTLTEYKSAISTFATANNDDILRQKINAIQIKPLPEGLMLILSGLSKNLFSSLANAKKLEEYLFDNRSTLQGIASHLLLVKAATTN